MTADITKSMIEIAIDRAINDIQRDPERSIRNLVDLGGAFTKGRFQKHLFRAVQTLLKNRQSAYYELGLRIIRGIDHATVKRFGVNVGYNGFTVGARKIRELEASDGYNIPWTLIFACEEGGKMTPADINAAVLSGKALGIYTYQIFTPLKQMRAALDLARAHEDCAFVLYLTGDTIGALDIDAIGGANNVMTALRTDADGYDAAILDLANAKCLYASYLHYGESEEEAITGGRWVAAAAERGSAFAIAIADEGCPGDVEARVARAIRAMREAQRYPVLAMDFYSDVLFIDEVISDQPCFLSIGADGEIYTADKKNGTGVFLQSAPLAETIRRTMPAHV